MPVTQELKAVRKKCEKLGIYWHPASKEKSLNAAIRNRTKLREETMTPEEITAAAQLPTAQELSQETKEFVADDDYSNLMRTRAMDSIAHLNGEDISRTAAVREYIQLLEARQGIS